MNQQKEMRKKHTREGVRSQYKGTKFSIYYLHYFIWFYMMYKII